MEMNENNVIIEVKEEDQKKSDNRKNNEESYGGIGSLIGRMFRGLGKLIKKSNENYFEIRKDNEKPIRISLLISIILFIVLTVPTFLLLVVGLFCGYRYSIVGKHINCDGVNDVFEKVSNSADNIKKDFKEDYEK